MEINLSYNTICALRDCVDTALRVATSYGDRVLTYPYADHEMEIVMLDEYLSMLNEFLETAR